MKHGILFIGVTPSDRETLDVGLEFDAIDRHLRSSEYRDAFELHVASQIDATRLPGLLMRHRPTILHFGGHGSEAGELVFRDPRGHGRAADAEAIADLLRLLRGHVRCVVLNACHSEAQARRIAEHVDIVVGMRDALPDALAIEFSAGFYEALGEGRTFADAFELARVRVKLADPAEQACAELHVRAGVDAGTARLIVDARRSPAWLAAALLGLGLAIALGFAVLADRPEDAMVREPAALDVVAVQTASSPSPSAELPRAAAPTSTVRPEPKSRSSPRQPEPTTTTPEPVPAEVPAEIWTVARIASVSGDDRKRIELRGPRLPSSGLLRLRTPSDGRSFVSDVACSIQAGSPAWCMLVVKPGNARPRVGDEFELAGASP